MPAPIPDLSRDQQCHHYQAPTGQRCGSPALKSQYYCYHHHISNANRSNRRVLIDPEITGMEIPPIEDRASIFIALAAVVHRLAENTIDTRRASQMIYGLQVAMRALEPPPSQRCRTTHAAQSVCETQSAAAGSSTTGSDPTEPAMDNQQPPPKTIQITKESLLYFLRSRHCYNCNTELFPAEELTERANAGAPAEVIEEARHTLPAPEPPLSAALLIPDAVLLNAVKDPCISPAESPGPLGEMLATDSLTLTAVASGADPETSNLEPSTSNLAACPIHRRSTVIRGDRPRNPHSPPPLLYTHLGARYPRDLGIRFSSSLHHAPHGPQRI